METISSNIQKYENYREQMGRLKKALKSSFYLEAISIEYAILEDRAKSVLVHSNVYNENKHGNGINRKLNKIKDMSRKNKSLPQKYFSEELIQSIKEWCNARNNLIHALLNQSLHTEDLIEVAQNGEILVKMLSNKANCYKRALEKQLQKEGN